MKDQMVTGAVEHEESPLSYIVLPCCHSSLDQVDSRVLTNTSEDSQ